jgi:hypothetical protein
MPHFEIHEFLGVLGIVVLGGLATLFWLWMLVECLTREPPEGATRVGWALGIALTHVLGASLYFLHRRPQRVRRTGSEAPRG